MFYPAASVQRWLLSWYTHHVERIISILTLAFLIGCQAPLPDISKATSRYPFDLHTATSLQIQVMRDEEFLIIVNSTANEFDHTNLWINQQYTQPIPPIPAGATLRVNLWDCYDLLGDQFNAGGFWRTDEPTALVIAELQLSESQPLVGLLVIGVE